MEAKPSGSITAAAARAVSALLIFVTIYLP
jgi:hypothetical protein